MGTICLGMVQVVLDKNEQNIFEGHMKIDVLYTQNQIQLPTFGKQIA